MKGMLTGFPKIVSEMEKEADRVFFIDEAPMQVTDDMSKKKPPKTST